MDTLQDSDQLSELYRLYGIAAHNCCNIEYRIAYLLLGPKWQAVEKLTPEKVDEVYEELYKKPLGQLLKEYKQHYRLTEQQIELAQEVLDKRNYLAHGFFGNYGKKMHDPIVLDEMITDLKNLIALFQAVSRSFSFEQQSSD